MTNISCDSGSYTLGRISSGSFVNGGTAVFDEQNTASEVVVSLDFSLVFFRSNTENAQLTINKSTVGGNGIFNFSGAASSTITTSNGSGTEIGRASCREKV